MSLEALLFGCISMKLQKVLVREFHREPGTLRKGASLHVARDSAHLPSLLRISC